MNSIYSRCILTPISNCFRSLLLIGIISVLAACGGGSDPSQPENSSTPSNTSERFSSGQQIIEMPEATVIVKSWKLQDSANIQQEIPENMILEVRENEISIDRNWDTSNFKVGDVIASRFGESGLLKRVVSITMGETSAFVRTEPVKLTEIFSELVFDVNVKQLDNIVGNEPTQSEVDFMVRKLSENISESDLIDFQQNQAVSAARFDEKSFRQQSTVLEQPESFNILSFLRNAKPETSIVINSGPFSLSSIGGRGIATGADLIYNINQPSFSCCFVEGLSGQREPVVTFAVSNTFGYQFRVKNSVGVSKSEDFTFFKKNKRVIFSIARVPIILDLEFETKIEATSEASGAYEFERTALWRYPLGFSFTKPDSNNPTSGARLFNTRIVNAYSSNKDFFEGEASLSIQYPKSLITVSLYGLLDLSATVEPEILGFSSKAEADSNLVGNTLTYNESLSSSFGPSVSGTVSLSGELDLLDLTEDLTGVRPPPNLDLQSGLEINFFSKEFVLLEGKKIEKSTPSDRSLGLSFFAKSFSTFGPNINFVPPDGSVTSYSVVFNDRVAGISSAIQDSSKTTRTELRGMPVNISSPQLRPGYHFVEVTCNQPGFFPPINDNFRRFPYCSFDLTYDPRRLVVVPLDRSGLDGAGNGNGVGLILTDRDSPGPDNVIYTNDTYVGRTEIIPILVFRSAEKTVDGHAFPIMSKEGYGTLPLEKRGLQ